MKIGLHIGILHLVVPCVLVVKYHKKNITKVLSMAVLILAQDVMCNHGKP